MPAISPAEACFGFNLSCEAWVLVVALSGAIRVCCVILVYPIAGLADCFVDVNIEEAIRVVLGEIKLFVDLDEREDVFLLDVVVNVVCVLLVECNGVVVTLGVVVENEAGLVDGTVVGVVAESVEVLVVGNVVVEDIGVDGTVVDNVSLIEEVDSIVDVCITVVFVSVYPDCLLVENAVIDSVDGSEVDVGDDDVDVQGFCVGLGLIGGCPSGDRCRRGAITHLFRLILDVIIKRVR